jgi:hypothetical protein
MQETVSAANMDERLARLQELIDSQQSAFNKAAIGATVDVLFERAGRNPGQIVGRTAYLQPAHVMASPEIVGQVLPVRIDSLERYSLLGKRASDSTSRASRAADLKFLHPARRIQSRNTRSKSGTRLANSARAFDFSKFVKSRY